MLSVYKNAVAYLGGSRGGPFLAALVRGDTYLVLVKYSLNFKIKLRRKIFERRFFEFFSETNKYVYDW